MMPTTMPSSEPFSSAVLLPITQEAQRFATQFACEQPTLTKARQVYLSTLAVCTVNNYLRILDVPTDLTAGDSWNAIVRFASDVADLCVMGVGRLECLPILHPAQPTCSVPAGIQDQRIGCVVVQLDLGQQEARLLGCLAPVPLTELRLSDLRPISELLAYLEPAPVQEPSPKPVVNLSQWWQGQFPPGWETIEAISLPFLSGRAPQIVFRRSHPNQIQRGRLLTLGQSGLTVIFGVTLTQPQAAYFGIQLHLVAASPEQPLPPGLTLTVLDDSGNALITVTVGSEAEVREPIHQLQSQQFSGEIGEPFQVRVQWGEFCMTEAFEI
jgi:hypothetical protein